MKENNYHKGITLIALVITIIVLLILAGVTINIVINKGIIDKTQTTVDEYKISDYKERIELIKTGEQFKKLNNESEDSLKNLVVEKLRERENENWVKEVETSEDDEALEENQIKVITQDKYIIIAEIEENGKITYLPIEKDPVNKYTISYDANGGTGEPASQTKNYGVKVTLRTEVPTKQGYTFLGWSEDKNATIATYAPGETIIPTKNMILYAIWEINNVPPVISSTSVHERSTNYITIRANATDADSDNLTYKLYLKTSNGTYSSTPNVTSSETTSGTNVDLKATGLSTYTIYNYKVEVTDGKSIVTSTEGTTGTGCSGTGKICTGPFTQEAECTAAEICATKTVSETCNGTLYRPGVSSGPYDTTNTCPKCGKSSKSCYIKCYSCSYSAYTVNCTNGSCGYTWNPKQGEHKKSVTLCIKHGKSNSHYYCAEHDQICSTTTHTITENVQCEHGKTSQHSCCDHGNTSLHFPN